MSPEEVDFEIKFYEKLIGEKKDFIDALLPLAEAYTEKGLYEKGLEVDLRLSELLPEDETVFYNLCCSYALTGKKEKAIQTLKKALCLGYDDIEHLLSDSDLKSIHQEKDFRNLLEQFTDIRFRK